MVLVIVVSSCQSPTQVIHHNRIDCYKLVAFCCGHHWQLCCDAHASNDDMKPTQWCQPCWGYYADHLHRSHIIIIKRISTDSLFCFPSFKNIYKTLHSFESKANIPTTFNIHSAPGIMILLSWKF